MSDKSDTVDVEQDGLHNILNRNRVTLEPLFHGTNVFSSPASTYRLEESKDANKVSSLPSPESGAAASDTNKEAF